MKILLKAVILVCAVISELSNVKAQTVEIDGLIVSTDKGDVRGHIANDGDYIAFLGIPYAAPPLGDYRFRDPIPTAPWAGVLEANRIVQCPQLGAGDEDCLILNVFTPVIRQNESLPVLFYIHGGSYFLGSGHSQGVEPLTSKNIIVVTINYRLGLLGFLSTGTENAPGNAGVKDMVAALRWVQTNIANFRGDPNQVTIYGMSAGSAAVELILVSNMANGLYHRAIMESGTSISMWAFDNNPIDNAIGVAHTLNYTGDVSDLNGIVDYLKTFDANQLSLGYYNYIKDFIDGNLGMGPCVEKQLEGVEPFIVEHPEIKLGRGEYNKVPLIITFASVEGLFLRSEEFYTQNFEQRMEENFEDFLPFDLEFNSTETKNSVAQEIKQFYFSLEPISTQNLRAYLDFNGDIFIMHGLMKTVSYHSQDNDAYLLEFAHSGDMGSQDAFYESINLAGHGDLIKHAILLRNVTSQADMLAVERVSTIISNFVKLGNPIPEATLILPTTWPTVQNNFTYLRLGEDLRILNRPYWERIEFWNEIYDTYGVPKNLNGKAYLVGVPALLILSTQILLIFSIFTKY